MVHDEANFTGTQWELNGGVVASLVQQPGFFIDGDLGARFMHIEVVNLDEFKDTMPFFVPELGFTLESDGDVTRTRGAASRSSRTCRRSWAPTRRTWRTSRT